MSAIFLSHSSEDNEIAEKMRQRLEDQGHRSVFLDFDPAHGIPAGRNWEQELYRQLRSCQAVIVLCSKDSMASKWCFAEITHAKSLGRHVFPIKVGECTINTVLTHLFEWQQHCRFGSLVRGRTMQCQNKSVPTSYCLRRREK